MLMNYRCSYMILMLTSVMVVCLTFFFHLLVSANQISYLTLRSELSLNRPPIAGDGHSSYRKLLANIRASDTEPHSRTLGVASHIYVLSLPRRVDRRKTMSSLSRALDLFFEYVDGLDATDTRVYFALESHRRARKGFRKKFVRNGMLTFPGFAFPGDHDLNEHSFGANWDPVSNLSLNNTRSFHPFLLPESHQPTSSSIDAMPDNGRDLPLSCATPEDPFPDVLGEIEVSLLPPWRILSRGMVACWIAHSSIIHRIAQFQDENTVAIILEDDVDMEFDIESRLQRLWPALPHNNWDIVMLGNFAAPRRMLGIAIRMKWRILRSTAQPPSVHPTLRSVHMHTLYPAMERENYSKYSRRLGASPHHFSRSGRYLLTYDTPYLFFISFAYSRALDQAIGWLIKTNKLRSYSIVPAVVVQSKRTPSDIWRSNVGITGQGEILSGGEVGSQWRDVLVDSTLERVKLVADSLGVAVDA